MKRGTMAVLAALSLAALLAGGCASKEVVKSEEPVVKAEQPKAPEVAKPEVAPQPAPPVQPEQPAPAAEPIKQAEAPAAAAPAVETAFESVYFDFDKSDLRQDARDVLSKNAEILLKSKPGVKVQIAGHCDERGSAEYNLALGERRAKSALHYLITLGVAADRLSIISYGKEKPAVDGHDEAAWAKNRRDEFVIVQ
ncbi:peptidoglycan-associated lipoprotein Pal [Geobacter sp. FeAm09]|uniref:peptidoglycan-associated lipoprotein Pal n=1 Tax=Geobacter sp. FeAm09 TaxID=2597769 RepID=UPI0011F07CEE|nr:peptidoglycan-associated lipoprotein Pal [Geobacter sp. FeAm09]QEM69709.1 peptidoglycan-associated lipoprotein Pal [Geobacter sp. FeAm09]